MTSALSQVLEILLANLKTQVAAGKNLLACETLEELNQSNVSYVSTICAQPRITTQGDSYRTRGDDDWSAHNAYLHARARDLPQNGTSPSCFVCSAYLAYCQALELQNKWRAMYKSSRAHEKLVMR